MLKSTLIAALAALSLGTALAVTVSPASAGCNHSYESAYENGPSYSDDQSEDSFHAGRNRYGDRHSGYSVGRHYADPRPYNDSGY